MMFLRRFWDIHNVFEISLRRCKDISSENVIEIYFATVTLKKCLEFKRYLLWYKWVSGIILTKHRTRGFWDLCHNVHKTSSRRFKDVFCSMWMDEALPNIGQESFEISFITSKRHLRDVFKDIFCGISGWTRPYQTQSKNPLKSLS